MTRDRNIGKTHTWQEVESLAYTCFPIKVLMTWRILYFFIRTINKDDAIFWPGVRHPQLNIEIADILTDLRLLMCLDQLDTIHADISNKLKGEMAHFAIN